MDYTKYVDTNIGGIGHLLSATLPAVQSPHGAAVMSPVFRAGMKDHYLSDKIFGFSAGCGIIMPARTKEGADYEENASLFDHDLETAKPDFYQVFLEDGQITERHTACENYGILEFICREGEQASALLYVKNCVEFSIEGSRIWAVGELFQGQAKAGTLFEAENVISITEAMSQIPNEHEPVRKEPAKAFRIQFAGSCGRLRFAISAVGRESAEQSFEKKAAGRSFEEIQALCKEKWNRVLGRLRVETENEADKITFYTAVYRVLSRMHAYSVDGYYRGYDGQIHADDGHGYYCDDGIWDTYRGAHPFQLLVEPKVHEDILASYLRMYEQSGWLPRFPYLEGNTPCMIGHHSVSLFADALAKGAAFDLPTAYAAAYKNATRRTMCPWRDGEAEELTKCYHENGFFPGLEEDEAETCAVVHPFENRQSVAVTMEHAYDDWCVARLAEAMGEKEAAEKFDARSKNYQKVYDPQIGFVRPRKADGSFVQNYNPKYCGGQGGRKYFAENNAYIYNFHVQQDIDGMIEMHGGREKFAAKLDQLYVEQYDGQLKSTFLMQYPDATGLMGQFCMGNEPSFHVPYLYNFCGQAWKTQKKVRELIRLWFTNSPLGICGDEDGGAMSAWLAFSALGFYTVTPGTDRYDLGSPLFDKAEIDLPNGRVFTIRAEGASGRAKYIQAASLNGKELTRPWFTHSEMSEGGELVLTMGEHPNKALWSQI